MVVKGKVTASAAAPTHDRVAERIVAWLLPSLADTVFALCLLGVVFVLQGKALGQDGDIGWHIQLGLRTINGNLPRLDSFSSTAYGHPLVGMEWLAEVCYAIAWRLAGLNGVVTLAGILIAVTSAGILIALRARGTPLLLALPLALLAIALTSIHWVARPHLFSFPLTLWWSEWLWRYWRDGKRWRLWAFPLVMVLWVNLHGGFLTGLILLGTAVVVALLFPKSRGKATLRALTLTLAGCLVATFANPWGWSWIGYFAAYFADPLISANTQELQSPDFHSLVGRLFLGLLLLLAATWIGSRRPVDNANTTRAAAATGTTGPEPLALAIAGVWTVLALSAIRAVPLWALVVTPLLAESLTSLTQRALHPAESSWARRWLRRAWRRSERLDATERRVGRGVWAAVALAFTLAVALNGGRLPGAHQVALAATFPATVFPVQAVDRLKQQGLPAGNGFNTVQWGGYLEYALPQDRVFIDSRSDFYGPRILRDYLLIIDVAPGWQRTLDLYHVRWALLPSDIALTQVLQTSGAWSCQPMDSTHLAVLCLRISLDHP
ncbi:MAG TPA: hypothetical protein VGN32_15595 [Ktedonobacterales bacterium]|nr:hypothetical protein [Ktedonobacterales bacterium]